MKREQIITTNKKMEGKNMKKKFMRMKQRVIAAVNGVIMGVMLMSTTCLASATGSSSGSGGSGASGTAAVTQPLENLKTLVIAVIGAVGVIILAKNVMEFAQAYQQQDSSTMNSALKGIVAGLMMAGISAVLTFLGF